MMIGVILFVSPGERGREREREREREKGSGISKREKVGEIDMEEDDDEARTCYFMGIPLKRGEREREEREREEREAVIKMQCGREDRSDECFHFLPPQRSRSVSLLSWKSPPSLPSFLPSFLPPSQHCTD